MRKGTLVNEIAFWTRTVLTSAGAGAASVALLRSLRPETHLVLQITAAAVPTALIGAASVLNRPIDAAHLDSIELALADAKTYAESSRLSADRAAVFSAEMATTAASFEEGAASFKQTAATLASTVKKGRKSAEEESAS